MCHYVGGGEAGSPVKMGGAPGLVSRLRPQASMADEGGRSSEGLQGKCSQLQGELERARRQLATEREEFHLKECKMEASLSTAHKANQELEVRALHTDLPHTLHTHSLVYRHLSSLLMYILMFLRLTFACVCLSFPSFPFSLYIYALCMYTYIFLTPKLSTLYT